ncbi:helix-turn-helix domain-containing protein [Caulobacter segnis]|uniref:helix-turn-helix domain-containing protein n=1 Tax=Caulobacter segnis TaxID=88688 RepID=UPI0024106F98|nr:helix-turn-helix domain-containing protein [Caulobacter segnis]MDG2520642.1 helix-turn-helix domain-containing protein [Caulobacter segnis]
MAHLVCELYHRLAAASLAASEVMELPLTQTDLADCPGLSAVHVNRTLQKLRRSGLLSLGVKTAELLDLPALEAVASFSADYLHPDRRTISARRRERL